MPGAGLRTGSITVREDNALVTIAVTEWGPRPDSHFFADNSGKYGLELRDFKKAAKGAAGRRAAQGGSEKGRLVGLYRRDPMAKRTPPGILALMHLHVQPPHPLKIRRIDLRDGSSARLALAYRQHLITCAQEIASRMSFGAGRIEYGVYRQDEGKLVKALGFRAHGFNLGRRLRGETLLYKDPDPG